MKFFYNQGLNKALLILVIVVMFGAVLFFLNKKEDLPITSKNIDTEKRSAPAWIQTLPEYSFHDVEQTDEGYTYQYSKELTKSGHLDRSLSYSRNKQNEYLGTIKLSFSGKEDSFVETIPKSFASHVDQLNFSKEPSRIINPDPVVEFTNLSGELEISSKEATSENEVRQNMEEQLLDQESKNCEKLEGPEMYACLLKLISKYRGSEYLGKELSILNLAELPGAVSNAVLNNNLKTCDRIKDKQEKQTCYEYGYQILVEECKPMTGKAYRDCVRKTSWQLPSMETRRLFCYHIDDESMYNECLGKADMSVCDEIINEDQKLICQLNIAKTKSNIEECEKIKYPEGTDLCRAMLGVDKLDTRYCDLVKDDYFNGECNLRTAMAKNDKTICANIKHQDSKDICYSYFGLVKQDVDQTMCDDIHEEFLKEMCELMLAMKNKDDEKCEMFAGLDEGTKLLCYMGIAVKHNDAEICSKITSTRDEELRAIAEQSKDACFYQIAINTKNLELCKMIEDADLKKECIEKLEEPVMPQISCSDVPPPVCPLEKLGGGAKIIEGENNTNIQCRYFGAQSNHDFSSLSSEMHRVCKDNEKYCQKWERGGMSLKYYESGKIKQASQYSKDIYDGYNIKCSETGELTYCRMFDKGKDLGNCMP